MRGLTVALYAALVLACAGFFPGAGRAAAEGEATLAEARGKTVHGDPLGLAMMAGLIVKEPPFLRLVVFTALPQADPERGHGRVAGFVLAVWPAVPRQIRLPVLAVTAYASSILDLSDGSLPSRARA